MVRAPCCEKKGLKKGPWTPEEDEILISYIQIHGHGNWRALPKHAGLLRCGKSCRLRWINYLRPDIKRGNFTNEEEDIIIKMHELLGNRWSVIAAKLPGRTDNEIKNVWHTHLKKRLLNKNQPNSDHNKRSVSKKPKIKRSDSNSSTLTHHSEPHFLEMETTTTTTTTPSSACTIFSSAFSSSEGKFDTEDYSTIVPEIDESFWSEEATMDDENSTTTTMPYSSELPTHDDQFPFNSEEITFKQSCNGYSSNFDDGMDFWYDLFIRSGPESIELPKF